MTCIQTPSHLVANTLTPVLIWLSYVRLSVSRRSSAFCAVPLFGGVLVENNPRLLGHCQSPCPCLRRMRLAWRLHRECGPKLGLRRHDIYLGRLSLPRSHHQRRPHLSLRRQESCSDRLSPTRRCCQRRAVLAHTSDVAFSTNVG